MSATNETSNYGLPQFVGTDIPTWLGDFNSAMDTIDEAIKDVSDGVDTAVASANSAVSTANSASAGVTTLNQSVSALGTRVTALEQAGGTSYSATLLGSYNQNGSLSSTTVGDTFSLSEGISGYDALYFEWEAYGGKFNDFVPIESKTKFALNKGYAQTSGTATIGCISVELSITNLVASFSALGRGYVNLPTTSGSTQQSAGEFGTLIYGSAPLKVKVYGVKF